jgi:hypothetical protein
MAAKSEKAEKNMNLLTEKKNLFNSRHLAQGGRRGPRGEGGGRMWTWVTSVVTGCLGVVCSLRGCGWPWGVRSSVGGYRWLCGFADSLGAEVDLVGSWVAFRGCGWP